MLLDDTGECSARKEGGRHVKIVVSFQEAMKWKEVSRILLPARLSFPQVEMA
jgi:neuron navigator 2